MPHHQPTLERQLNLAETELQSWNKILDGKGVDTKGRRKDTRWRSLNARRRQITKRLKAAAAVVALDEEVKQRRASAAK
jgi:hypothetical protein